MTKVPTYEPLFAIVETCTPGSTEHCASSTKKIAGGCRRFKKTKQQREQCLGESEVSVNFASCHSHSRTTLIQPSHSSSCAWPGGRRGSGDRQELRRQRLRLS